MTRPKVSITDSCELPSPAKTEDSPPAYPPLNIDSFVVNNGGTGVHRGNITNYTVNQYIVPGKDDCRPEVVTDFVTDCAVKLCSDTKKFFPDDSQQLSLPGWRPRTGGGLRTRGCRRRRRPAPGRHKETHSEENESQERPLSKKEDLERVHKRGYYMIGALLLLSFFMLMCTFVYSLTSVGHVDRQQYPTIPVITPMPQQDASDYPAYRPTSPRIMDRSFWVAQPPTGPLDNNTLPIKRVIVCHTATESCLSSPDCVLRVRYIQMFHMESMKWSDIGYNFLIGGDGGVYVGRGWDKMGAHTKGENNGTLGIAFIGTYISEMPNKFQLDAFNKLINLGVEINKISENYTLVAQCQIRSTAAPGLVLVNNMTSWPHFDSSLPILCTT